MEDDSLIARAEAQPSLPLPSTADLPASFFEGREAVGEFTGERLFRQRPEVYRAIVTCLAEGIGVRATARALKVSTNTVAAVRAREGATVETQKKETVSQLRQFARLGAERLLDEVDKIPLQSLPIAIGIAVEKAELLDGGATARVEHVQAPGEKEFKQLLDMLPEADAQVVVPTTGFEAEESAQKDAARAGAGAPERDREPGDSDMQSECSQSKSDTDTVSDTDAAGVSGDSGGGDQGGRGSGFSRAGGGENASVASENF